jgi:putative tricarboxylic transport membrane protein
MTTRRSVASLAAIATAALALTSGASAFPDKLLQFVTPYPFGGSHALHASIITTAAEPHFGQPMISVIRTGGGGVVGADYVLKSPADGHVMLFGDPNLNSLRPQVEQLSFSVGDFIPIARINYSPWVFVAKPEAPFGGTIKGMADWAKANPDKLIYSSDNVNGPTHVVFLLMEQKTGAKMWPLQLGGGGPAITNLLGSNTMAYAGDPSVVGEHILGGKLKGLCVTDTQRWASLPTVPTCREAGIDVVFHFWRGVLVPKGTPADRVAKLSEGFGKLVKDISVVDQGDPFQHRIPRSHQIRRIPDRRTKAAQGALRNDEEIGTALDLLAGLEHVERAWFRRSAALLARANEVIE